MLFPCLPLSLVASITYFLKTGGGVFLQQFPSLQLVFEAKRILKGQNYKLDLHKQYPIVMSFLKIRAVTATANI